MVQRVGGSRRKTRDLMKKPRRMRGKLSLTRFFAKFSEGDKVILRSEPSYQKGIYFRRFHAKVGVIEKKRGSCYEVSIKDGNKRKTLVLHPVHLKRV